MDQLAGPATNAKALGDLEYAALLKGHGLTRAGPEVVATMQSGRPGWTPGMPVPPKP